MKFCYVIIKLLTSFFNKLSILYHFCLFCLSVLFRYPPELSFEVTDRVSLGLSKQKKERNLWAAPVGVGWDKKLAVCKYIREEKGLNSLVDVGVYAGEKEN